MRLDAPKIRKRLAFDVERLRRAAHRVEHVDRELLALKGALQERARHLSGHASSRVEPELGGDGIVQLRYAQAQATAELARHAALGEVLEDTGRLSLIASMAVSRWVSALSTLTEAPHPDVAVKGHIDTGRLAHRLLSLLRPKDQLKSGCGQLTSAVVVAELAHSSNQAFVADQIEEGLVRGRNARRIGSDEDVVAAASRALRAGASLLESIAERAEPALVRLLSKANGVEAEVEAALTGSVRR